ncbi:amidohydrolase 3 [Dothidotthia symphoricarpi CBS 119687]|uniref:Amidohydrolase 3 n=1 Tax=Dothidotthia symphoricarpi CBS 119687 TaxID=1392245 RepID=A0A6A5ZZY3_9PLEO|nr:amidohydrolase 3 [Dothidotthia symphoricarpi CBS 119687]KAF2124565.1 amidohydrolase 3 [Dothidotthia symphoricarpi CBS 119687]
MPSISTLFWASIPILLAALIYQVGVPAILLTSISEHIAFRVLGNLFATTHCYASVKTLSEGLDHAECFSVSGGVFTKVFPDHSLDAVKHARTGYVVPGFWDGHGHLLMYGELLDSVSLFGAEDMREVKRRLVEYQQERPETGTSEQWLRGVGWDQANFDGEWPVSSDLEIDNAFKDLYVMLDRVDVHCIWVSEKVLSLLPSYLPDMPGGEIPAKGVFCDNAMDIVLEHYPKPGKQRKTKFIKDAMSELNRFGIVGMHDAGVVPSDLELYKELSADEDWTVRVNAMVECEMRNTFCPDAVEKSKTPKLQINSVKLFGDGALGSWGSAMIEPYSDKLESSGSLLVNTSTLSKLTLDWAEAGFQVNIHSIGDLANRHAIDAFEAALEVLCPDIDPYSCQSQHRFRIEHAQIIHPEDQSRLLKLGIIPSIQPTHATSDMGYAESRLGKQRTAQEAYRMRSLLSLRPVLGSDFPVEPPSILEGMYAAITRRSPRTGLDPNGSKTGWYPEETITLGQALEGFTVNAAYGAFLEGKAGIIKPGAYADWVVLDESLETTDLRKATIRETWVGGKRVYLRPAAEGTP